MVLDRPGIQTLTKGNIYLPRSCDLQSKRSFTWWRTCQSEWQILLIWTSTLIAIGKCSYLYQEKENADNLFSSRIMSKSQTVWQFFPQQTYKIWSQLEIYIWWRISIELDTFHVQVLIMFLLITVISKFFLNACVMRQLHIRLS